MTRILIGLIRIYQRCVSVWMPSVCRFYPSCSEYAVQALSAHGLWGGARLAVRRLLSCHPFHPGGYDPVPPPTPKNPDEAFSGHNPAGVAKGQVCR